MDLPLNIQTAGGGIYLPTIKAFVVADLHLGLIQKLQLQGMYTPDAHFASILQYFDSILRQFEVSHLIVAGDFQDHFGAQHTQVQEDQVQRLCKQYKTELVIITGNHDKHMNKPTYWHMSDILITHGDKIINKNQKLTIIGHQHPALAFDDGIRKEKAPVFLHNTSNNTIILPALSQTHAGTDIKKQDWITPYVSNQDQLDVYIAGPLLTIKQVKYVGTLQQIINTQ